jgi:hypothetical protein
MRDVSKFDIYAQTAQSFKAPAFYGIFAAKPKSSSFLRQAAKELLISF